MQIYTGIGIGKKLAKIEEMDLGIMISSSRNFIFPKSISKANIPFALDNGAYSSYKNGYPFDEFTFLRTISMCLELNIKLDFIVLPDIIGDGRKSLSFSLDWERRIHSNNLALVLHPGIEESDITQYLSIFQYLFLGGISDEKWKWSNAEKWCDFAHKNGKKFHIGACGTIDRLKFANEIGVDSLDSTSWVVNESWHILDEFRKPKYTQLTLF